MSLDFFQTTLQTFKKGTDDADLVLQPVRKSIIKRFPVAFTLAVTFGVASIFFGFERIISEITFLNERPVLILILGIVILAATGTLYKKL
jgi:energy-converting hydrogenase Eha subunit E